MFDYLQRGSGALPLIMLTLWDKVFLSFGSFSLLFAVKKKENEHTVIKKF